MNPTPRIDNSSKITFLIGLLLSFALVAAYLLNPYFIQHVNNKATDSILANADFKERSGRVVVVDIDEKSLDEYGQWPWPRYRFAKLLRKVQQLGVSSIGLNMVFAEPDRSSPRVWQDAIREELGHEVDIKGVPEELMNHDAILAETFSKGPFFLGYEFLFDNSQMEAVTCQLNPMSIIWVKRPKTVRSHDRFFEAGGAIRNLDRFSESVSYSGFLNATPDSDGMLRRVPMIIKCDDGYFPSIALATLMRSENSHQAVIKTVKNGQHYLHLNDRIIPLDNRGNLLVNFSSARKGVARISAADVLGGTVSSEAIRDKIVFVATSASGLERIYQTPCCHTFPEAEVHAQVMETVLTESFIVRNRETVVWEIVWGIVLAVLYCISLVRLGVISNIVLGSLFVFGSWQGALILFRSNGVLLSPLLPFLVVIANFVVLTIFKYWKKHHSAKREVETALVLAKTNENTLNSIVNTIPDIVYRLDAAGRITFVSQAISTYGPFPEGLMGQPILDLVPSEKHGLAQYRINERRTGNRATKELELPLLLDLPPSISDTQEVRYFSISAEGIYRTGKPSTESFQGTQGIARDITEKKLLENQVLQAKKMKIVATVAGGVAHDLNNLLTSLISYPELLLMDRPKGSPDEGIIKSIRKSGEKAAELVQDLLTLARRGVAVKKIINVNAVVREYLHAPEYKRIRRDFPDVVIRTELSENLLNIEGSPVHIYKVLMNLVNNAAEAMPAGGEIILQTRTLLLNVPIDGYTTIPEGDYCRLSVIDNGVGISEADAKQIFEPYFTKKQMGKSGSGLGMTVVWATIQDHGGYVDIESQEGVGTRFDLYLPVTRQEVERTQTRIALDDYTGNERILVVDDSPMQREIYLKMLGKLGYTVASVSSGEEALQYLKQTAADLIILDMILGKGMDGLETYKRIAADHPKQKIIIVSGFLDPERSKELRKLGATGLIQKPFSLEQIGLAVRKELDRTL